MTMRRCYQIAGLLLFLFGAFVVVEALQLHYYTSLGPGPGFFSFWVGIVLSVLAVVMVGQATFGNPGPMPADFFSDRPGYLRMAAVIVSLIAATLLLERLGFLLTMLALFLFLLRSLGGYSVLITVSSALVGSVGVYYVFSYWLRVPLPGGVLGPPGP